MRAAFIIMDRYEGWSGDNSRADSVMVNSIV